MQKKQQEKTISVPGCLALGLLACTPGILLCIAAEYNLMWLGNAMVWLILISCILLLLFLVLRSNKLGTICRALLILIGIGLFFDILFGKRK